MARYYPGGNNRPKSTSYADPPTDIVQDNFFSRWLYGEWSDSKFKQYALLRNVPLVRDYMDYLLDYRDTEKYFGRYGMDWSDIYDPRKLSLSDSTARFYGSTLNFVSKNIERLYR